MKLKIEADELGVSWERPKPKGYHITLFPGYTKRRIRRLHGRLMSHRRMLNRQWGLDMLDMDIMQRENAALTHLQITNRQGLRDILADALGD